MANVALRAYLDDIAHLIDQEALEEVIGHCKYILTKFPKNLAVYRLYGTALAGKSRYDEARDIFERVLSASPNDFAAHVSMSEIFQEQGLEGISRAIWHLERAYEQDPNNPALQDELKRLYDQRDGAPPETINLTRGALARLYYKSQLYDQAAAELNLALRESPDRPDLLILLSEAQWDNHRPVEAGETALRVLQNFPYSMDANRIMAKLWLENNRPSDAQEFIQRLAELDPFVALELVKPGDEEAKEAITIQRLDWNARSSATLLANAPDWVQGMGDFFDTPQPGATDNDPFNLGGGRAGDWATNFTAPTDVPVPKTDWFSSGSPFAQAAQSKMSDDLPDWFADVQTTPPAQQSQSGIPSWLEDVETDSTASALPHQPTGFTDLLNEFGTSGQQPPAPAQKQHTGFTDLLNEFGGSQSADTQDGGFTDLMNEFGGGQAAPAPDIPDWLNDSAPASTPGDPGVPDWLNEAPQDFPSFTADLPAAQEPATDWMTPSDVVQNAEPAIPDWLNESPSFGDIPAAEVAPAESLPDWLTAESNPIAEVPMPVEDLPAQPAENLPNWLNEIPKVETPMASLPDMSEFAPPEFGDLMVSDEEHPTTEDWLNDLPPGSDAPVAEENADWLSGMPDLDMGQFHTPLENTAIPVEPVQLQPVDNLLEQPADDWLDAMKDTQTGSEPAAEESSDWLSAMPDLDMGQFRTPLENTAIPADPVQPVESAGNTDWLSAMRESPVESSAEPVAGESADWLSTMSDPAAPVEQPAADDWLNEMRNTPAEPLAEENGDWMAAMPKLEMDEFGNLSEDDPMFNLPGTAQLSPTPEPLVTEADMPAWTNEGDAPIASDLPKEPESDPLDWMTDPLSSQDTLPDQEAELPKSKPISEVFGRDDDWLSSLRSIEPEEVQPEAPMTTDELLDWMSEEGTPLESNPQAQAQAETDLDTLNLDEWMNDLAAEPTDMQAPPPMPEAMPEITNVGASDTLDDDWLRNFEIDSEPEKNELDLSNLLQDAVITPPEAEPAAEPQIEEDWLASFEPESNTIPELPVQGSTESWLDQLAASAPPPREPLILQEAIIEQPPSDVVRNNDIDWGNPPPSSNEEWLSSLGTSITPAEQSEPEPQDTTPEWMRDMPTIESEEPAPTKKTGMTDMLGRIKRGEIPAGNRETGVLDPNRMPDWMNAVGGEPIPPSESGTDGAATPVDEPAGTADLTPDWLASMGNDQPADLYAPVSTTPEQPAEELSGDWLQNIISETSDEETRQQPVATGDTPNWLSGMEIEADAVTPLESLDFGTTEPEAAATGDGPGWLQGITPVEGTSFAGNEPEPQAEFDFGTSETSDEQAAAEIDINALLRELNSGGLAKENELVDNTSSSRFQFDRTPAWLRKRKN